MRLYGGLQYFDFRIASYRNFVRVPLPTGQHSIAYQRYPNGHQPTAFGANITSAAILVQFSAGLHSIAFGARLDLGPD